MGGDPNLLTVAHAGALGQGLPVSTYLGEIRQLESHAQRNLSQPGMIVLHELYDLFTLLRGEFVVLEQIAFAEDLADAQDLVTGGVQGEIQEVAAALQGF